MSERLYSLDLLRGLLAFGIMFFHLYNWIYGHFSAMHPLSILGIYGVPAFYILSGIALSHVYAGRLQEKAHRKRYFIRRLLRIFPMLMLSTICTIILFPGKHSLREIVLNLSGLFSLLDPPGYIAIGAWSIGNELVFYLLFPMLLLVFKMSNRAVNLVSLVTALLFFGIGYAVFKPDTSFQDQWPAYIHYLNQFFFFFFGVYAFFLHQRGILKKKHALYLFPAGAILIKVAQPHTLSDLISGSNRMLLSLGTIGVVCSVYLAGSPKNEPFKRFSSFIGRISFAVYMLHPLVYHASIKYFSYTNRDVYYQNKEVILISLLAFTVLLSTLTTKYFMEPMYNLRIKG